MDAAELSTLCRGQGPPADPTDVLRRTYWALLADLSNGDLSAAAARLDHASLFVQRSNPIVAEWTLGAYRFELSRLRGDKTTLARLRATDVLQYRPDVWMGYTWLFGLLDAGHRRSARVVHDVVSRRLGELSRNVFFLPSLGIAVWAAEVLEDAERARRVYELLLPYEGEMVTSADSLLLHGPVAHFLAGAAGAMGNFERAHAHLDAAMGLNERLGLRVPGLLSRKTRALLWMREGRMPEARAELERLARQLYENGLLGLARDLPREFRWLEEGGVGDPGSSPPGQQVGTEC